MRHEVHERDHGVCALCGLDTDALEREAVDARTSEYRRLIAEGVQARYVASVTLTTAQHGEVGIWFRRSLWEADHIVPVAEGGGGCGLENYRTLCIWCHPKETGKLRRRLNASRRPQGRLAL